MPHNDLDAERVARHTIDRARLEVFPDIPAEQWEGKAQKLRTLILAAIGTHKVMNLSIGYTGYCPAPSDN